MMSLVTLLTHPKCKDCKVTMRRAYIAKYENGGSNMISFGWACQGCKRAVWDKKNKKD